MDIKLYENWMQPQVTRLFSLQYERNEEEVAVTMQQFYEHPFQQQKCIRLVAMEGDLVIGFQSLFYWPYERNGKVYNSFQSGNSLVHPGYRGKGIFQKLLKYLDDYNQDLQIDFLMGFPVQMSYGSFMKNKWDNPLNIVWKLKIINPLAFLFSIDRIPAYFGKVAKPVNTIVPADAYRLVRNESFENWINSSRDQQPYCSFHFSDGGHRLYFSMKTNKRSRWMNELIIGDIRTTSYDPTFVRKAFSKLIKHARRSMRVSALTIAINEQAPTPVAEIVKVLRFIDTGKSIYFITKSYNNNDALLQPKNWELYRSDVDTW
jgi:GNAT superfamily N-acetyltransferase